MESCRIRVVNHDEKVSEISEINDRSQNTRFSAARFVLKDCELKSPVALVGAVCLATKRPYMYSC